MTKPIVPWIGGKRRLAKHILPLFPEHQCYVEPFAGASALFFMKEAQPVEVLNDINSELVNLYRVVKHHLDEFIQQFRWSLVSREMFAWEKLSNPSTLTDIQRAARFYYLQKLSFGGKVANPTFGTVTKGIPKLNFLRIGEELSIAHLRLSQTIIEHLDWQSCIRRYDRPHTLFYCDPPYWGTEGYGVEFGLENYTILSDYAQTMEGKMIVSVNDIPEMRKAFAKLHLREVDITYTVGGNGRASKSKELIITNF